jgi:hypothetical protein
MSSSEDRKFRNQNTLTKVLVPEEIDLIVSSDPANGARNPSADGSTFQILLQDGIKIPSDAKNINVSVEESTVWWVVPNIETGVNDTFYITGPRASDDALTPYVVVVPQGLYDLTALNQTIQRDLENQGAKTTPDPIITLLPDDATQKAEMRFSYIGTEVDFTPLNTFREILGWGSEIVGPNIIAPTTYLAPNIAQFNQVNYFLVHSDLVSKGIRFNNDYSQTISQVLINVPPGSQIVSTPFNPAKSQAGELAGATRTALRFWLTDDRNRLVNTNGEYWTARVKITYLHAHWI